MKDRRLPAAFALTFAALVGCTTESGTAIPEENRVTTSTTVPRVTTPPRTKRAELPEEAPEVTEDLDLGTWWERPCDLLDDATAQAIGLTGDPFGLPAKRSGTCLRKEPGEQLQYILYSAWRYNPYKSKDKWRYFAEATLAGQPTGVFSSQVQPTRVCIVAVGLSPTSSIKITLVTSHDAEVCDRALAVASVLVDKIAEN